MSTLLNLTYPSEKHWTENVLNEVAFCISLFSRHGLRWGSLKAGSLPHFIAHVISLLHNATYINPRKER